MSITLLYKIPLLQKINEEKMKYDNINQRSNY